MKKVFISIIFLTLTLFLFLNTKRVEAQECTDDAGCQWMKCAACCEYTESRVCVKWMTNCKCKYAGGACQAGEDCKCVCDVCGCAAPPPEPSCTCKRCLWGAKKCDDYPLINDCPCTDECKTWSDCEQPLTPAPTKGPVPVKRCREIIAEKCHWETERICKEVTHPKCESVQHCKEVCITIGKKTFCDNVCWWVLECTTVTEEICVNVPKWVCETKTSWACIVGGSGGRCNTADDCSAPPPPEPPPPPPPTCVSLIVNPSSGKRPLTVNLTGSGNDSDGFINQYQWDFDGNGTWDSSTSGSTTSYTYANAGSYTAKLRVRDDDGAWSSTPSSCQKAITVTVNQPPTCLCAVAPTMTTLGNSVQFRGDGSSDSDGSIVSYRWNFGDGIGTSTQTNPVYTYGSIGAFTANLTVTDNNSAISSCSCPQVTVNWATGTISGTVYEDKDGDCVVDPGETGLAGVLVSNTTDVTSDTTVGNGQYSVAATLNGNMKFVSASKTGYSVPPGSNCVSYPSPRQVGPMSSSVSGINFFLWSNPSAWFQTRNGDVHSAATSGSSITSLIPDNAQDPEGNVNPYFSLGAPGVVTGASGSWNFNGKSVSQRNWGDRSYTASSTLHNQTYAGYFAPRLTQGVTPETSNIIPHATTKDIYYYTGNVTARGAGTYSGTAIFLIDGNLTIQNEIKYASGDNTSALVFLVGGNITISNPSAVNEINGIFLADGQINLGATNNQTLTAKGIMIAHGGFVPLTRSLSNNIKAAEFFEYEPRYLIQLANLLGKPNYTWLEVEP